MILKAKFNLTFYTLSVSVSLSFFLYRIVFKVYKWFLIAGFLLEVLYWNKDKNIFCTPLLCHKIQNHKSLGRFLHHHHRDNPARSHKPLLVTQFFFMIPGKVRYNLSTIIIHSISKSRNMCIKYPIILSYSMTYLNEYLSLFVCIIIKIADFRFYGCCHPC